MQKPPQTVPLFSRSSQLSLDQTNLEEKTMNTSLFSGTGTPAFIRCKFTVSPESLALAGL